MKKIFIYSVLLIMTLSSCIYEFNIDDVKAKNKAVIFCMPNTLGDTTLIQVSQSITVNNKGTNSKDKPIINYRLNGEEKEIKYTEEATEQLPAKSYYVLGKLKEGDKINIEASYPNMTAVKSQTVIPEAFPIDNQDISLVDGTYGKEVQFRISFTDNANTKDYYGVRIVEKIINDYYGELDFLDEEEITGLWLNIDNEPLLSNKIGLEEIFDIQKQSYLEIYTWDDSLLNGKSYTLHLNYSYREGYDGDNRKEIIKYKIYLYKLSEEMYKYLNSINSINNNELGEYGLAPIRSHYTNIENGIGLLGGCNIYESEWIDNPKNEEDNN